MRTTKTMAMACFAILLASTAMAATADSIKNASDGKQVSLRGTVEDFNNENTFTLRDSTGSVKVDLGNAKSMC